LDADARRVFTLTSGTPEGGTRLARAALMSIDKFLVNVPQHALDDLQERLRRTRWMDELEDGWTFGTERAALRALVEYWTSGFDWRRQENAMNRFAQFRAKVDGVGVHFIHERGVGDHPLPIVLTHGYPDSFLRFAKIIPMLTHPEAHGADPGDAFDVVVPSLPGFGFSDKPAKPGAIFRVGDLWHRLMTGVLGYDRFAAHGGDWGSTVTEQLARSHARSLVGVHLTDVPFWHMFQKPGDLSADEQKYLDATTTWQQKDGAYALIQGTRPYTLARGLNDSPAGLASWIVDKFHAWSDCNGNVENAFTKDELLTNVTLYWVTETIGSSFLPYADFVNAGALTWAVEAFKQWLGSTDVPAAFAMFPKDISHPPREWAARFFNVQRWTEMPRGGHFAALETPDLLVDDIRRFFRPLRGEVPALTS
jgi:pimeloyl-ACP methyl ester carboxylesterase